MRKGTHAQLPNLDALQAALARPAPSPGNLTKLMRKEVAAIKLREHFLEWKGNVLAKLIYKENRDLLVDLINLLRTCDVDHLIYCLWMLSNDSHRPHKDKWNHLLGLTYQELCDNAGLFRNAATKLDNLMHGALAQASVYSRWNEIQVEQTR